MKIKINQLADFTNFYQKVKSQSLPFKTSYKLALLNQECQKHTDFYQEEFRKLIMQYSQKDEEGNPVPTEDGKGVRLAEGTTDEAYAKLDELNSLDVELPDTKFAVEDFDKVELSPEEILVIMPFIAE